MNPYATTAIMRLNPTSLAERETIETLSWGLVGFIAGGAVGKTIGMGFVGPGIVGALVGAIAGLSYTHPGRGGMFR